MLPGAGVGLLALAAMVAGGVQPASAQGPATTASIQAMLLIDNTALIAAQVNDLDFGVVIPGTPTSVNPKTSALAGKYVLHGTRNAEIQISFVLPSVLQVGPWTMPISFADDPVAGRMGCHRNQDQQNNCTRYTPTGPLVVRIRNGPPPQNTFYVWIGGTVSPAVGQQPGIYRGTVTMSAVYTGN